MNFRSKGMIILLCLIMVMTSGCALKEETKLPYEGNLDKIKSEIANTNIEIDVPEINQVKRCRATSYEGKFELNAVDKSLSGIMDITIVNETDASIDKLCIRNYAASILESKNKGRSEIFSVINTVTEEVYTIDVKDDASVVYVNLNTSLEPNETITISVTFCTDIPRQDYRFGYHQDGERYSFLLTYCFPVLAMYEEGAWLEYPYISYAESNFHTPADYKMEIQLPEKYTIAATGEEYIENNVAFITAESIRDFACVVSNYMNVSTIIANDIEVNLYSLDYKNLEGYNEISLLAGKDSIELLEMLVGEYPYKELDIVQCFYLSAMEYPGLVLVGYPDVESPNCIGENSHYQEVCSRIAHETAHQWFYAAIGSNCYKEAWLDEGFSEYFEEIIYPLSGCESVKKAVQHDNASPTWGYQTEEEKDNFMSGYAEQRPQEQMINLSYEDYEKELYAQYVYDGSTSFLHELRKEMGDGIFFRMLQTYYKMGYMKEVTTKEFITLIKVYDDSEEINVIIEKYILLSDLNNVLEMQSKR